MPSERAEGGASVLTVLTLYHGTDVELRPGQWLVPGDDIGRCNWPGMDNGWAVWLTPDAALAARYGKYVYEVEPVEPDDYREANGWEPTDDNAEWVALRACVVAVVSNPDVSRASLDLMNGTLGPDTTTHTTDDPK